MTASTEVSPEGLWRSSDELAEVGARTDALLDTFQQRLDSCGEPWGTDELGAAIGGVYGAAHAMAMNCYNSNLDTMDGYAERLGVVAFLFAEADQDSRAQARALLDSQWFSQP
ncbi:hypothetical protein ACN28C_12320 [Plantactinospora sp. WMMC1484]|uniref:hypothetical protein n=1 Tax=Plantactinospora sp. WMMC1484 TaxID=3404122 RepID=UPI003BF462D3